MTSAITPFDGTPSPITAPPESDAWIEAWTTSGDVELMVQVSVAHR
jgi:hypothetical protein